MRYCEFAELYKNPQQCNTSQCDEKLLLPQAKLNQIVSLLSQDKKLTLTLLGLSSLLSPGTSLGSQISQCYATEVQYSRVPFFSF